MKNRNSLIELYRFIFAMNVVKNHGYFPYQGKYFSPGAYSVDFFFVLTGFFLIRSLDKFKNMSLIKGLPSLIWKRLYSLGIPLVIGLLFNIIYKVSIGDLASGIWMYLWYINDMLMVIVFYYFIRKYIKNEKVFISIVVIVALVSNLLLFTERFDSWGWFRAFGSISVGILTSYIPLMSQKNKKFALICLIPTLLSVLSILLFDSPRWAEVILNNLLYPCLIYFSYQFSFNCQFCNYLGALSFGLYAFQSIARCALLWGINNLWLLFAIILVPTVVEDGVKRLIKRHRLKVN